MVRELNYEKIHLYLQDLSNKHVDVKDYVIDSPDAIQDKINTEAGLQSPFIAFNGYEGKLAGNQQRTFNERTISFVVCFTGVEPTDFEKQAVVKAAAESIGLDFLSRINIESKTPTQKWLYNNFEKASVNYHEVELEFITGCFGMQFNFDLKTVEPLVVDPSKWIDGDQFCEPNY